MAKLRAKNSATLLFISMLCLSIQSLDLDRDLIRKSILEYRAKRSLKEENVHDLTSHVRVRRQASVFPSDDEDFVDGFGSGEMSGDGGGDEEPLPPDVLASVAPTVKVEYRAEWVWYRCKVNFLDSIVYTSDLQDYTTGAFHSYSDKIMYAVEDYLRKNLAGYHEATPLMFTQRASGDVDVLIDVGACSTNTAQEIEDTMRSLLRTGRIADLAVSEEGFSIRHVGADSTREECLSAGQVGSTPPSTTEPTPPDVVRPGTVRPVTTRTTTRTVTSRVEIGPSRRPYRCDENEATCRNGQCIDRRYICDGNRDCDDGSDEPDSCGNADSTKCDPTEFLCVGTGVCVQKLWRCDGDDDCGNGYDELNCPTASPDSVCRGIEFECLADSLCVPASYQCDGESDCSDSSDERGCSSPVVITPPIKLVTAVVGDTVELDCEAVGVPTPVVSWRLNWGNVGAPPRVTMTSSGGRGKLIITDARRSDQGAYTCEAINSEGSIFAVPDAVLIVEELPADKLTCPPGYFGTTEDECRPCYCFGITDECQPSKREYDEIGVTFSTDEDLGLVELRPAEVEGGDPTPTSEPINRNQIVVKPAARELQLIDLSKRFLAAAHYWSLPAQFLGAKINSYGGTLTFSFSYNNSYNFEPRPTNHSDVIIEGANGKTLVYHDKGPHPAPKVKHKQEVELAEDDWTTPEGERATRQDMLNVLNDVDKILLRTVYDNSMLSTGIGDIRMTVANPSRSDGRGSTGITASAVEECICPDGYTGLSCQYCSSGYERITVGPFVGHCELITNEVVPTLPPCDEGYTGTDCRDCAAGYYSVAGECVRYPEPVRECDTAGSYGVTVGGECDCKPGSEGERCNRCKPGYFYLAETNADGCLSCFCMGVSRRCGSTSYRRMKIVPNYRDEGRFLLTNAAATRTVRNNILSSTVRGQPTVRVQLGSLPKDVYYWVLPTEFTGNKITSYGGKFQYTITYGQTRGARPITRIPDVKIVGNDITLEYRSGTHPQSRTSTNFEVDLIEDNWVRPDGSSATREHLMMALADIESFIVRATYSNDMLESMISAISVETAASNGPGRRALDVEECICPEGYTGLSCEDCAPGYRRIQDGPYLGTCARCSCNGHSQSCDELTGSCIECQHNTVGENCDRCIPGFYGDPRVGTVSDCRPCPCPLLPSRADRPVVASCSLDIDGLPTCDACPPGYEGRQCDRCATGFVADLLSPGAQCKKEGTDCQCDPYGSIDGTCDADGQCNCRESVRGLKCDSCKPSYFYFSVENENGCLPCFCMGVTTNCASSYYIRDKMTADFSDNFGGFALTNRVRSQRITSDLRVRSRGTVLTHPRMNTLPRGSYYWQLADEFLGDKVVSYGGELRYTVSYTPFASGITTRDPDVIIIGNDITLVASIDGDVGPREQTERSVIFKEKYWRRPDGQPATREHLLMALADLEDILIRATYSTSMLESTISQLSLEISSPNEFDGADMAYDVEHCTCPDGYEGLSCEDCAPGYTRSAGGLYLGLCQPCQCNGHADICDTETGECVDCRDNTVGPNCDQCAPGYYSMSDDPVEMYCQTCACPGTGEDSFSKTCEYSRRSRNLVCNACQEGYEGSRCENCAEGYEGNPRIPGGRCSKKGTPGGISQAPPQVTVSPSSLNIAEGSSATFSCTVRSSPPVRVRWRRVDSAAGRPISTLAIISDRDYTLTIPRITRDDAGTYECIAQNTGGVSSDQGVLSIARNQPMIKVRVEEPANRRLRTGSEVTFVCTATSKMPGYIIYWSKQGGRLPRGRFTDYNGILHISDLRQEDSGTYVCTGSNMYEIDRARAVLTVVGDFHAVRPTVSIEPARQVIREGEEAVFRCSANGTPPIKIEWRPSSGETMPETARIVDGELYIPSVSLDHSAVFYCRASNAQGAAEATALLDVTAVGYPPRVTVVTPTTEDKTEGDNIVMKCTATGLPRPLFSWSRLGKPGLPVNADPMGGTLQLINVQVDNRDTYICTARNAFGKDSGRIQVNIAAAQKIQKPICKTDPETLTAYVGAEASITCVAEGDPPPTITWARSDGMRLQSNVKVKGNKLIIHNVTLYNSGRYICIASNAGGTTRSEMTLKVEDKQLPQVEILPRNQQVVEVGESASFTCRPVSGHPVEVTWSRTDRKPFTARTKLKDGGVISFTNVTAREGGSYICIARNVVGFREVATLLSVIRKPTITIEPSSQVYLREGTSVTLRCNADGIPAPNVAWKKVSMFGHLIALTQYKRHSNELRITNVKIGDSAQYKCVAVSAAGDAEKRVTVTVGEREAIVPPEVTVEKSVVSSVLGARVQLRCAATGQPEPDIVWSRKYGRLPAGATQADGVLTIPRTNQLYAGIYVCKAGNPGGFDSAESTLKIIVAPKLRISPSGPVIRLSPGNSAVITCSAVEGTPPITYQFSKASGRLSRNILTSGDRMQVLSFNEETDSGRYICTGRNEAGVSTIEVTLLPMEAPSVTVSPKEVTVSIGQLVNLQCVTSDENADITWSRSDSGLMDESRVSQANGFLRIENTQLGDAGEYKCTATNEAGSSSATAALSLQGPPQAKMMASVGPDDIINVGDRVVLTCVVSGNPRPTLTITKDGAEVLEAEAGKLVLNPVLSSDTGSYACVAANDAGSDEDVFELNVRVVSRTLSIIPDTPVLEVRSGDEMAISCMVTGTELPVTWTREGGSLPSAAVLEGNVIQIEKISLDDKGIYICNADLGAKTLRKIIEVKVHAFIPYFTQSPLSYISLKENPDFYRSLRITISFRPNSGSGLLLYSYGSNGDFMSLALFDDGKMEFRYNVGSGDAIITSPDRVAMSEWHTVTITRHGREGQMTVDNGEPVRGMAEGSFRSLDLNHPLYIGGYPSTAETLPPSLDYLGVDVGFYGCISQLVVGDDSIDMGSSSFVREQVGVVRCKTCGRDAEDTPCQHKSTCLETHSSPKGYTCNCTKGHVGPECQFRKEDICGDLDACGLHGSCTPDYDRELGYRCECEPGFTGPKCQYEDEGEPQVNPSEPLLQSNGSSIDGPNPTESLVDDSKVSDPTELDIRGPSATTSDGDLSASTEDDLWEKIPEATAFGKGSYMQLDVSHNNPRQFDVRMSIKPHSLDDGLILHNGGVPGGRKRAVEGADIFVSLAILNGTLEFRYNCGSGLAILTATGAQLNVGQWHNIHANRANRKGILELDGVVVAEGSSPKGGRSADLNGPMFVGGVQFWDRVPDQAGVRDGFEGCIDQVRVDGKHASLNSAVSSKNVDRCEGQTSTVSITDPPTTEAPTTTAEPTTAEEDIGVGILFLHSGRPAQGPNSPLSGTSARFTGNSYAAFREYTFPHNMVAEQLSLYFKTTEPDGLLLVHGKANSRPSGGDFILLGLRNARLQYSFQLGTSQGKAMGSFPVADGQWHRVTVVRRASLAFMWLDDLPRPVAIQAHGVPVPNLRLGYVYIGGVTDVPMYTGERFKRGFKGCIRDVRFTSMDQQKAMQIGATYLDDSDQTPLLFGELDGRVTAKNLSKCLSDVRYGGPGLH